MEKAPKAISSGEKRESYQDKNMGGRFQCKGCRSHRVRDRSVRF